MRSHFSRSVMVSAGVSIVTRLHFVNPRVKINGKYFRVTLLKEELLPDMHDISEYFIFQQENACQLIARSKQLIFRRSTQLCSFHPANTLAA